jgi:hypothetical protein
MPISAASDTSAGRMVRSLLPAGMAGHETVIAVIGRPPRIVASLVNGVSDCKRR